MRITEPSTSPPPRILSSSAFPREIRSSSENFIADKGSGYDVREEKNPDPLDPPEEVSFVIISSCIVFHSPQAGHLPSHFALSLPHDVQNHPFFTFAIPF
jgi:hypothetical protein